MKLLGGSVVWPLVLAIVYSSAPASGFSCYFGVTTDGSLPTYNASGCTQCSKIYYKFNSQTLFMYSGSCTSYPTIANVTTPTANPSTASTTTPASSSCAASSSFSGLTSAVNSLGSYGTAYLASTLATSQSSSVSVCLTMTTVVSCTSSSDSANFGTCMCCSDNCNSASFCNTRCSAPKSVAPISIATVFLLAITSWLLNSR